jgi:hypothetical protein
MPEAHYTSDDIIGVVLSTILFAPLLLAPGYLLGWLCNPLGFRRQSRSWKVLYSLVLSVSAAPILVFLLGTFGSDRAVWTFYFVVLLSVPASRILRHTKPPGSVVPRWAVCAALAWALVVWLSGIDLQFGDRLYPPVFAYDLNLRTEVIHGLSLRGLPAVNPLFFPGHAVPLRYHYFWFLPCAMVERLGGGLLNARHTLIAADAWCGWALMAIVVLYLRHFHPAGDRKLHARAKWGIAMLAVAGLDILPNLFLDIANHFTGKWFVFCSAEWWNSPVTAFPHAVFFEAHHVAGLIACFTGFLLLWAARRDAHPNWASAICAGLCFATAAGTSIYVAFTFAIFLAGWGAVVFVRGGWSQRIVWVASGATAAICAGAYLSGIRDAGGAGGRFLLPTVRSFSPFDIVMPSFGFTWNQIAVANFIALPLNYFLETGMWFVLAVMWCKRAIRRRNSDAGYAALMMFGTSLLVGTFLKSGVINFNDLGWRSVLIAQLILLIWSVDPLRAWWRRRSLGSSRTLAALVVLGLASTVYDFVWMRFYIPLSDRGAIPVAKWFGHDHEQGARTFSARQAYEKLDELMPAYAVMQANPNYWNDVLQGLYGLRQTASFDWACGSTMGGNPIDCERMQRQLIPLFNDPTASKSLDIDTVCDNWGINVLVAKDDDPVFQDREAWPWQKYPLAWNERVRAIECGVRSR